MKKFLLFLLMASCVASLYSMDRIYDFSSDEEDNGAGLSSYSPPPSPTLSSSPSSSSSSSLSPAPQPESYPPSSESSPYQPGWFDGFWYRIAMGDNGERLVQTLGKETRETLKEGLGDFQDTVKTTGQEACETVGRLQDAIGETRNAIGEARDTINATGDKLEASIDKLDQGLDHAMVQGGNQAVRAINRGERLLQNCCILGMSLGLGTLGCVIVYKNHSKIEKLKSKETALTAFGCAIIASSFVIMYRGMVTWDEPADAA